MLLAKKRFPPKQNPPKTWSEMNYNATVPITTEYLKDITMKTKFNYSVTWKTA